jgi:hypothetical protein
MMAEGLMTLFSQRIATHLNRSSLPIFYSARAGSLEKRFGK